MTTEIREMANKKLHSIALGLKELEEFRKDPKCPNCKSKNFKLEKLLNPKNPFKKFREFPIYVCGDCGYWTPITDRWTWYPPTLRDSEEKQ